MTRRQLFVTATAAVIGVSAVEPAAPLRRFRRYDPTSDKWTAVSGFDIKDGDVILLPGTGEVVRVLANDLGEHCFTVDYKIDPTTNSWVVA